MHVETGAPMRRLVSLLLIVSAAATGCDSGELSCSSDLDTYCAANACARDFATAAAAACGADHVFASNAPCDGYDFVKVMGVDTYQMRWYDHATGALVAITHHSTNFGASCLAGPSEFTEPSCAASYAACDAGSDVDAGD